jgi:hypothetical protein
MHKNATKCNETLNKWCKNKHGASKIMNTLETYQCSTAITFGQSEARKCYFFMYHSRSDDVKNLHEFMSHVNCLHSELILLHCTTSIWRAGRRGQCSCNLHDWCFGLEVPKCAWLNWEAGRSSERLPAQRCPWVLAVLAQLYSDMNFVARSFFSSCPCIVFFPSNCRCELKPGRKLIYIIS